MELTLHQTLNGLVVDDLLKVAQRERDKPIAIGPLCCSNSVRILVFNSAYLSAVLSAFCW